MKPFFQHFIETVSYFLRISPLYATPVDHAPTTAFATEASRGAGPPISAPVPKQLGSTGGRGLGTTVSDYAALMNCRC